MLRDYKSRGQLNQRFPSWYYIGGDSRKCGGFHAGPLARRRDEALGDYERRILSYLHSLPHIGCPGNPLVDLLDWPIDTVFVCGVNEDKRLIPIIEDVHKKLCRYRLKADIPTDNRQIIRQMRLPIGNET